jgi:hypothetical protein
MTKWRTSPEDVQRIVAYAQDHEPCIDCGAGPGQPCARPGSGRSVHKSRYVAAAIAVRQVARAAQRTPEQAAILAALPRVSREEIEAGRSSAGGFTRAQLAEWGVPWPPPSGWLRALLREEGGRDDC